MESQLDQKVSIRPKIAKRKLWFYKITALIVIPLLLLLLFEISLRIFGYGYPTSAIVKYDMGGKSVYCNNPSFGLTFFSRNIVRDFDEFAFPVIKDKNTFRIFILGSSAAFGEPDSAYNFGRILMAMLERKYPDVKFEVINMGMSAINSHVVLEIAKDCTAYKPDLFIIYLGNNEVVGPYGAGTVFSPLMRNLSLIRLSIAVKKTKLGQLIKNVLDNVALGPNAQKSWGGLEMFLENQVRRDDSDLELVYDHFEHNLNDICKICCQSGAKVILCNVGTNLKDCPPFASLHRKDINDTELNEWHKLYQNGVDKENVGEYQKALDYYFAANKIDKYFADLHYRIGQCQMISGDYTAAKESYIQARDTDTLRFRADSRINDIIQSVSSCADFQEVFFVDAGKALGNNSPYQIPGKELFYEHVHLNFKGNYIVAGAIFERLEKIIDALYEKRKSKLPFPTLQQCAERLAYTGWDHRRVTEEMLEDFIKKPPFTNQLYHDNFVALLQKEIDKLVEYTRPEGLEQSKVIYQQAISQYPSDRKLNLKYADFLLSGINEYDEAKLQYEIVLTDIPDYIAYINLGLILYGQGDLKAAIDIYHKGIKRNPNASTTYYNLGLVYHQQGNLKNAIKYYIKAIKLSPNAPLAVSLQLAKAYVNADKIAEAIKLLSNEISKYPENAELHFALGTLYMKQGYAKKAINELRTTLTIQPNNEITQRLLMDLEGNIPIDTNTK